MNRQQWIHHVSPLFPHLYSSRLKSNRTNIKLKYHTCEIIYKLTSFDKYILEYFTILFIYLNNARRQFSNSIHLQFYTI